MSGLQHTASLLAGGLQATCAWDCSPKDPPGTGRNNNPGGMGPVSLAKVPWAVICRAGQDVGSAAAQPLSNIINQGARWICLPPPLYPFFFPSPCTDVVELLPHFLYSFQLLFSLFIFLSSSSLSLPVLQHSSCSLKREGVASPFVLVSW